MHFALKCPEYLKYVKFLMVCVHFKPTNFYQRKPNDMT